MSILEIKRKEPEILRGSFSPQDEISGKDVSRTRKRGPSRLRRLAPFAATVVAPFLAAVLYYAEIATDRYVSEAHFTVQKTSQPVPMGLDIGFLTGTYSPSKGDAFAIKEFVLSSGLLHRIDDKFFLRSAYASENVDWASRLAPEASEEDFLKYWRGMVSVEYDLESGIVHMQVQDYDSERARAVLSDVLAESEKMVNEMSRKLAEEEVSFSAGEVSRAESRLRDAEREILSYQDTSALIDPKTTTASVMEIVAGLEAEIASKQAELTSMSSFARPNAPQIVALRTKIDALKQQISAEKARMAGSDAEYGRLNAEISKFEELKLNREFALTAYKSATASHEASRVEASKKLKSVVTIVPPTTPDEAMYPDKVRSLLTVLVALIVINALIRLTVSFVKDHAE